MPTTNRKPNTGLRLIRRGFTTAVVVWLAAFALGFCSAVVS